MKCSRVNCQNEAAYRVRLALGVHAHHKKAMSTEIIRVCEEHRGVQWDDVVTPQGWGQICREFKRNGWAEPKPEFSHVVVEKINQPTGH